MSQDHDTLLRRWFEEVWTQGREEAIDSLLAEDCIAHGLGEPGVAVRGPAGFKPFWRALREAFEVRIAVEETISDGERAACRWHGVFLHRAPFLGIAPSGKRVEAGGMSFVRIRDGRIVEGWNNWDLFGLLQQLGGIPGTRLVAPGGAETARS
jgi:steroid delta-isomerase-like uncharacterized protein